MSEFLMDFSKVEEKPQFSLIPNGDYTVTINKAELGVSQAGNNKISLDVIIEDDEDFSGRHVFDNVTLTQKCAFKTKQLLEGLGSKLPEGGVTLEFFQDLCDNMVSEELRVKVGTQKGTGQYKDKNVIKFIYPITEKDNKPDLSKEDDDIPFI